MMCNTAIDLIAGTHLDSNKSSHADIVSVLYVPQEALGGGISLLLFTRVSAGFLWCCVSNIFLGRIVEAVIDAVAAQEFEHGLDVVHILTCKKGKQCISNDLLQCSP